DGAPPPPRLVERRNGERFAEGELLDLRHGDLVLGELDEVPLLLPREMGDHPRDRIDRLEPSLRLPSPPRPEPAHPLAAREPELRHERMRRHRSSVFFIPPSP